MKFLGSVLLIIGLLAATASADTIVKPGVSGHYNLANQMFLQGASGERVPAMVIYSTDAQGNLIAPMAPVPVQTQVDVSVTTTSAQALAAHAGRLYLLVQNKGTGNVYLKFGSAQGSPGQGVLIVSGGNYEPFKPMSEAVFLESDTGTNLVSIVEGY